MLLTTKEKNRQRKETEKEVIIEKGCEEIIGVLW